MPEAHARLSASGAHRWMACTPSVKLEEQFPDKGSEYAAEGTLAHAIAELIIRYNNKEITKRTFSIRINKFRKEELYSKEMEEYIAGYAENVWEIFNEARGDCPDAQLLPEQRLDFSKYVPQGFGTGDIVIIADDMIQVIDLKYGKGVGVSAERNPQLRLYGIGAYLEHSMLYDIRRVKMTIIQPRLENISTEELTVEELLDWAEKEVKPKAELAMNGEGEYLPGEHCRFCKAKAVCRARAEENLALAKLELRDPDILEEWEIGEVLQRAEELNSWAKDVKDYAFEQALNHGVKYEGWKLAAGRSNRKYLDEDKVKETLIKAGYQQEDITETKLLGITAMEKAVGKKKFGEVLSGLVIKPEGKPVLVPESDNHPELNAADSAKNDFEQSAD